MAGWMRGWEGKGGVGKWMDGWVGGWTMGPNPFIRREGRSQTI